MVSSALRSSRIENWSRPPASSRTEARQVNSSMLDGIKSTDRVIDELARSFTLIAPSHPGFGRSELPRTMTTVDDLAYFYLDLMEALDLKDVVLAGVSFGGWIAAEIAIKSCERISHLVLADAVSIKIGDREQRDIVDMFTTKQSELDRLAFHHPTIGAVDHAAISDE